MRSIIKDLAKSGSRTKIVTMSFKIPQSLKDEFKKLCDKKKVTESEVIRKMIEAEIEAFKK